MEESVSASAVHSQVRSRGGRAARLRGLYLPRHRHTLFIRARTSANIQTCAPAGIQRGAFYVPLLLPPPPPPPPTPTPLLVVVARMLTRDTRDQEVEQGSLFWKGTAWFSTTASDSIRWCRSLYVTAGNGFSLIDWLTFPHFWGSSVAFEMDKNASNGAMKNQHNRCALELTRTSLLET